MTPYSVSPRRRDQTVRPKPTKYCVTLTSKSLPGIRCPSSCRPMEAATPTTNRSTPRRYISASMRGPSRCGGPSRLLARPGVGCEHVVDGEVCQVRGYVVRGEHALDGGHDVGEPHLTVEEGLHADLVGGVVDGRGGAAAGAGLAGQPHRRERLVVEREELPGLGSRPVHGGRHVGEPVRPAEPEGDRDHHRRRRGLREGRAVVELQDRKSTRLNS